MARVAHPCLSRSAWRCRILYRLRCYSTDWDLRLHRHVQGRGRLVEHDKPRLQDQRAGDRDALALAARELVRVALGGLGVEPDLDPARSRSAAGASRRSSPGDAPQPLFDDLRDREPRRQARERVVKDHLHLARQRARLALAEGRDVGSRRAQTLKQRQAAANHSLPH